MVTKSPPRPGRKGSHAKPPAKARIVRPTDSKATGSELLTSLLDQVLSKQRPFGSLCSVAPMLRVGLVKAGVPPR